MKKKLFSLISVFVIVCLSFTGPALAKNESDKMAKSNNELITVLNPAATAKYVDRIPLAPRLDSLEGKTLYMLDINWGGPKAAYSVFEQMKLWFAEHMPSVKVVIKRKRGSYMVPDDATWKEVKDNGGDAAIVGISG